MSSTRNRCARGVVLALFLFAAEKAAYAAEQEHSTEVTGSQGEPTPRGVRERHRVAPKKSVPDEVPLEKDERRIVGPHGPAMDGVRGSGIAPAPGAFGTDAGSPSDLHR